MQIREIFVLVHGRRRPALVVVHLTAVRPEERYLRHRFGESYERYVAKVPRYVGRRRR